MTNNELLSAFSDLLDSKLKTELQPIKDDLRSVKENVAVLNERMDGLEKNFVVLNERMDGLEKNFIILNGRVENLEKNFAVLNGRVENLEKNIVVLNEKVENLENSFIILNDKVEHLAERTTRIELILENETNRNIQILAENYVPAARRYEKAAVQMETMQADIDVLKSVVASHSEKLQMLACS